MMLWYGRTNDSVSTRANVKDIVSVSGVSNSGGCRSASLDNIERGGAGQSLTKPKDPVDKGDDGFGGECDKYTTENQSAGNPDQLIDDSQGGDGDGEANLP